MSGKRKVSDTKTVALTNVDAKWARRPWVKLFLEALKNSLNVRYACEHAHITRQGAYQYRDRHPKFAEQWDEAIEDACDILEGRAWKRSETSDQLLIFMLKAHRPEKYSEHSEVTNTGELVIRIARDNDQAPEIAPGPIGDKEAVEAV